MTTLVSLLIALAVRFTAQDTLLALDTATPLTNCIVYWEVGRPPYDYDPYSVGDNGMSLGVAQLHKRGLLPAFYAQGYDNPFNPYQAIEFTDIMISEGYSHHWSPVKLGLC